jgi:3-dehydroquinate synthase
MPTIRVKSSAGSYAVVCAPGALARAASLASRRSDSSNTYVLSSARVWRNCGRAISARFPGRAGRHPFLFDDREHSKNLATVESIARQLVHAGADRRATLVAVGGGVVGDVAGFVAATYLRGVRVVHIPTTLVAQVDSSIGGKTGVNLPEGKNLVGAFYPPKVVIADPALLATLPHREYRSGLYEVVKYGAIADRELFTFLERRMSAVLRRDPASLGWIIQRSVAIKARVVSADEREGGLRQILNFGHTLGHALETATDYRLFLHGEAIAWGMIAACMMALSMNRLPLMDAFRIVRLVASVGPLPRVPPIPSAKLRSILAGDKKSRGGRVLWVFPRKIGKTEWGVEVGWPLVERAVRNLPEIMNEAQNGAKRSSSRRRPS